MSDLMFPVSLIWTRIALLLTYFRNSLCYPSPKNCTSFDQNSFLLNIIITLTFLQNTDIRKSFKSFLKPAVEHVNSASLNDSKSLFSPHYLEISCHCLQTQHSLVPQNTNDLALYSIPFHFHLLANSKEPVNASWQPHSSAAFLSHPNQCDYFRYLFDGNFEAAQSQSSIPLQRAPRTHQKMMYQPSPAAHTLQKNKQQKDNKHKAKGDNSDLPAWVEVRLATAENSEE